MANNEVQGRTWADAAAVHSSVSTWVPADPAACFDYVSDFGRHNEWTTHDVKIAALDGEVRGLGARYRAVGRMGDKDWPSELTVTIYDRPVTFEFTATGGPIGTPADDLHRHTFTFTADGDGTRLTLVRRDPYPPEWGRFKRTLGPVVVRLTLGLRRRTIANLRQRLMLT